MSVRRAALAALLLAAWACSAAAGEPAGPGGGEGLDARIEALVADLGSKDWQAREDATRELLRIGPPAAEALRRAAGGDDLEVRLRAEKILWQIRRSLDSGAFGPRFGVRTGLDAAGGGEATEAAVRAALDWLARHQSPDGTWSCKAFAGHCADKPCGGPGADGCWDPGVTALAALAFLGAGHTHTRGTYRDRVRAALTALQNLQDEAGRFGPRTEDGRWIHNQAVCTLAVAEGYGMSGKSLFLHDMATRAVKALLDRQTEGGGWGYTGRPALDDVVCTSWAAAALFAARTAGLFVPDARLGEARAFLDRVTDEGSFRARYRADADSGRAVHGIAGDDRSESATACAVWARMLLAGRAGETPAVAGGSRLLLARIPARAPGNPGPDLHAWFWAGGALFQRGGEDWSRWNTALKEALLPAQHTEGCARGSFDPSGPWGATGGRVYATALAALILEVYYRCPKLPK